jgi:hypothetical protein
LASLLAWAEMVLPAVESAKAIPSMPLGIMAATPNILPARKNPLRDIDIHSLQLISDDGQCGNADAQPMRVSLKLPLKTCNRKKRQEKKSFHR